MIQNPRGTYDIYGPKIKLRDEIIDTFFDISNNFGFEKIETPIFEETSLFVRAVGEETDVVSKEMYTFLDKKERSLTLRPELTAPIVRSYIQEKMHVNESTRLSYFGPAFRYERPQKGRFRQFHQFGVEVFGQVSPIVDAEIIVMANEMLQKVSINDNITLKINTLGNLEDRLSYIEVLKNYLNSNIDSMCDDCKRRIYKNPLRVLDCKVDTKVLEKAPSMIESMSSESKVRFEKVLSILDKQDIKYTIDSTLVRGLDYYNDTVFEFEYVSDNKPLAVMGGGRYDNLVGDIGGVDTKAFGFGIGIERILDIVMELNPNFEENYSKEVDVYYMPLVDEAIELCANSAIKLRKFNIATEFSYEVKSLKSNFKKANNVNAVYAVIVGEDELKEGLVTVKNLISKQEVKVVLDNFENDLISEVTDEEH